MAAVAEGPTPQAAAPAPPVSVIVVSYNSAAYLGACLGALRDHSGPGVELIVLDNASADGSADLVARDFPEARLIRSGRNLGFGAGNNLAAASARGAYLALVNPDACVTAGWLEPLIAALEADPGLGLATPKILLAADPERINTCGNQIHISGITLCRGMGAPATAYAAPDDVGAVSGAAFVIRRALWERLGGFDADFFMYMEDTDLSWRARLAGYRCRYVPTSLVLHDYALRVGPRKLLYQERNRYLMLLKSLSARSLLALLPALLLAELLAWGFVLLRDRANWRNKPRAYAAVWRARRTIASQRRATRRARRVSDRALLAACASRLDYAQAGEGPAARLAALALDPLFAACRGLALALSKD